MIMSISPTPALISDNVLITVLALLGFLLFVFLLYIAFPIAGMIDSGFKHKVIHGTIGKVEEDDDEEEGEDGG